jgi:hypothetical protein
MIEDDLVQEVRAVREAYCRQFGYDLAAIMRHLREQEQVGDRPVVRLAPKRPVVTDGEQSESVEAPDQIETPAHHSEPSLGGSVR